MRTKDRLNKLEIEYDDLKNKYETVSSLYLTLFERFTNFENEYQMNKNDYPIWFNTLLSYFKLKWKWDTSKILPKFKIVKK